MRTLTQAVHENQSDLEDQGCLPEEWCGGTGICRLNNISYGYLIYRENVGSCSGIW